MRLLNAATRDSWVEVVADPERWTGFELVHYPYNTFIDRAAHATKMDYLVGPNDSTYGFPSCGILVGGGLRYGKCTHEGNSGVNFYSYLHQCFLTPGWVALRLKAVDSTRLRNGRKGRHCVNGPVGSICSNVEVTHMVFSLTDVPPMVYVG